MNLESVGQTLRLREYYYMVLRRKHFFFGTILTAIAVAVALSFVLPKSYTAEAVLLVNEEKILNPLISGLAISPRVRERVNTLTEELLSWNRLSLLAEKLGLDKDAKTPYEYEQLIKTLRQNITIKMKGYALITVSFEGPDPKIAQEVVQTLSDIVVEGTITAQNDETNSAVAFIEDEMEVYREKLEKSESDLREFKEIYAASLPVATRLNEQLVALKVELNRLLTENTEEHPRVIQSRKLIAHLEKQRDLQFKEAGNRGVDVDPSEYAQLVSSVPRQQQQLAKLNRDYSVSAKIYEALLEKLETAKISNRLEDSEKGTKFKVLEPARLPLKPSKPNKLLLILGGLFIGLGLGSLLVYILELGDNSIRSVDEARFLLELPILGAVTTIRPEELIAEERLRRAS